MTTGAWATTPPYTEEPKDRWIRLSWAARHFKIDRLTLLGWVKDGTVKARVMGTSGRWEVSEQSLKTHLFGSPNAGT